MSVKLLAKHHLEFLSLTGGYIGSRESTLVKMSHCWKSHVNASPSNPFDEDVTILTHIEHRLELVPDKTAHRCRLASLQ